ncbi:MAG: phosphoserine phosphatase SerB [Rhodospirillaceae bacterium]|nr:MAG: phosphoserine phosphatase SerB [Rhodospirillaceae bacterium]
MDNVLTLITNRTFGALDNSIVSDARTALQDIGAEIGADDWLSANEAVDIPFHNIKPKLAESAVRSALGDVKIDIIAQRTYRRRKKLIIADMDSTIVTGETLDELADFAGLKSEITAITQRAMRGELDFAEALHARVKMLKNLDESYLAKTMDDVELTPGAEELIKTMRGHGAFTALISGGFSYFTDRIRESVGFHTSLGNHLGMENGKLTGKVIPPIVGKEIKLEMLIDMAEQQGLGITQTLSIGDGANDVPMLTKAGMGIAYHAHPVAREAARARLDHADLAGALFIQGYRREDFLR